MAQPNIRSVVKVGSSVAVVIPANIAAAFGLLPGDQIAFAVYDNGTFCGRKVTAAELLQIKPPPQNDKTD